MLYKLNYSFNLEHEVLQLFKFTDIVTFVGRTSITVLFYKS